MTGVTNQEVFNVVYNMFYIRCYHEQKPVRFEEHKIHLNQNTPEQMKRDSAKKDGKEMKVYSENEHVE